MAVVTGIFVILAAIVSGTGLIAINYLDANREEMAKLREEVHLMRVWVEKRAEERLTILPEPDGDSDGEERTPPGGQE